MKNITLILFLLVLAAFISCQSETAKTNPDLPTTFANLYVRYMEAENRIKATANFDRGKNQKNASSIKIDNGVFFHNANMKERQIPNIGTRYIYEMVGDFSDSFKFRFTEPSKGKMDYVVNINPIKNITIPNGISKSKGMTVHWEGLPLAENEGLAFLIQGTRIRFVQFQLKGKTETSKIIVPAEKIKDLSLGASVKIEIVRTQSLLTEEGNFVAECNTEFYALETEATVVP